MNRTDLFYVPLLTCEPVVVPVEDDLTLGVAHPVENIEGREAEGEHQSCHPVNSRRGVNDNTPSLRLG